MCSTRQHIIHRELPHYTLIGFKPPGSGQQPPFSAEKLRFCCQQLPTSAIKRAGKLYEPEN